MNAFLKIKLALSHMLFLLLFPMAAIHVLTSIFVLIEGFNLYVLKFFSLFYDLQILCHVRRPLLQQYPNVLLHCFYDFIFYVITFDSSEIHFSTRNEVKISD